MSLIPSILVLLAEGKFKLETIRVLNETDVLTRVVKGGFCKKRGINLPKTDLPVPALSDNDKEDLSVSKVEFVGCVLLTMPTFHPFKIPFKTQPGIIKRT